jgi:hypothetical protein
MINFDQFNRIIQFQECEKPIINPYNVTKQVEKYYRKHVKGNRNKTTEEIRLKLSRDIILAKEVLPNKNNKKLFLYGYLEILLNENEGTIVWIRNNKDKRYHYYINLRWYKKLNQILGIGEKISNERENG